MLRAVANTSKFLGDYTYASVPAASAASGFTAFISDWGANGTLARSNGTRWLPVSGQTLLKRMGAAVSGVGSTETIVAQVQMPIGSLQSGDTIRLAASLSKSGTTDALLISFRVGTAGTVGDTALTGLSALNQINSTNLTSGALNAVRVLSTTSMTRVGGGATNGVSGYGGSAVSAAATVATTGLPDLSSNAVWLTVTIKSSGTTDTVGVQELALVHEAG